MSEKKSYERMSMETLSEKLLEWTENIGRRGFLRKLTMGSLGVAAALFGTPKEAQASGSCCNLCLSSTRNCAEICCWQWACCTAATSWRVYLCKECYYTQGSCNGGCNNVACSESIRLSFLC